MKYCNSIQILVTTALLVFAANVSAASDGEATSQTEKAAVQTQVQAEYEKAISLAKQEQLAAQVAIGKARKQLQKAAEQERHETEQARHKTAQANREEASRHAERAEQQRTETQREMENMRRELNQARRLLQEASREVARVNRELSRAGAPHANSVSRSTSERPVIGVILGDPSDVGVRVLGVSPDGPSERAGIQQGDVIVAVDGRVLAAIEETNDTRDALMLTMRDIKAEEPLTISVERGSQTLDLIVLPEVREPLTWQTITRFRTEPGAPAVPAPPGSPDHVISIERIVVPEIDSAGITQQIEKMRVEIDERRALMEEMGVSPVSGHHNYEFEIHEMSDMGNFALQDANVWFGLPMAQGLQLAEINAGLGEYFKTDRGVLVLKARTDNELQLASGDVILQVGNTKVNSPAEFMRALRGFEAGDELKIEIKRKRKDRTLQSLMPEDRTGFFSPEDGQTHRFEIITQSN